MIAIAQPANVRSAYTDGIVICPEPPPDAALQAIANATAKVATPGGTSVDVSGGLTTSIITLAGRTQTVLIARDAFTANCILRMNKFITSEDAQKNFKSTLEVIQAIVEADKEQAEADNRKSVTEMSKVVLEAQKANNTDVLSLINNYKKTQDDSPK